ncbi:MAG: CHAD domain-containing protein, partial [Pseudomonadota bacterium]|nr:CHAD domain-containing protein [Pseudomonadota bacterium]
RLSKHKASLRLRKEGDAWVQTAKASTGLTARRLEQNVPVEAPPAGTLPQPDPLRHDGSPVGKALRKALGGKVSGDADLSMRYRTDVLRTKRVVRAGDAKVEVALDVGTIVAGEQSLPVCELEFELKSGDVSQLVALASQWAEKHGLWISTPSKAERGSRLSHGNPGPQPVKATTPAIDATASGQSFFAATLQSCLAQVLQNASGIAEATEEDEGLVHQLRIGIRRLRTALRELQGIASGIDPDWEPVLQRTFQELGDHRDLAIVVPAVRKELEAAKAPSFPDPEPLHRTRRPTAVVRDPVFQRTLFALIAFEDRQARESGHAEAGIALRSVMAKRLGHLRRRIARDGKRFAELETSQQHKVRKKLKRLRYLSEFTAPLFGAASVHGFLDKWKDAQDALGEYNDQRIAVELFRSTAERDPNAWFVVGWLEARRPASVKRCSRALREASKAASFWKG